MPLFSLLSLTSAIHALLLLACYACLALLALVLLACGIGASEHYIQHVGEQYEKASTPPVPTSTSRVWTWTVLPPLLLLTLAAYNLNRGGVAVVALPPLQRGATVALVGLLSSVALLTTLRCMTSTAACARRRRARALRGASGSTPVPAPRPASPRPSQRDIIADVDAWMNLNLHRRGVAAECATVRDIMMRHGATPAAPVAVAVAVDQPSPAGGSSGSSPARSDSGTLLSIASSQWTRRRRQAAAARAAAAADRRRDLFKSIAHAVLPQGMDVDDPAAARIMQPLQEVMLA